jgi:hypothetical protein
MNEWREAVSGFLAHLRPFRRIAQVDTTAGFADFLDSRAAFVSQKKLYEYVKQRMGMSFPAHFANDEFIASLNAAKMRVYAACLSDLAVWMAANMTPAASSEEALSLTTSSHDAIVTKQYSAHALAGDPREHVDAFAKRVALTNLDMLREGENAFQLSPKALVHWAPIADELKRFDTEIVVNSLRFAWLGVRDEFRTAIRPEAVMKDWRRVNSE